MPSLRHIRKRIRSVKNTQKITKAMKMVAAAKLRRAQDRITAARPYALELQHVVGHLAARVAHETDTLHPLLQVHPDPKRILLVVITSDRGLAGGFNSNILRRAERFLFEQSGTYPEIRVAVVGRKGRDHFRRTWKGPLQEHVGVFENLTVENVRGISDAIVKEYTENQLDAAFLLYNEFKSAISQKVIVEQVLPIVPAGTAVMARQVDARGDQVAFGSVASSVAGEVNYRFEPAQQEILGTLLHRYVTTELWRALLESVASEQGARMTAMDSATKNAAEMVSSLTLSYNRARQAAITKELMEIIGGAEALK